MEIMLNRVQSEDLHYKVSDLQSGFKQSDAVLKEKLQSIMKEGAGGLGGSSELAEMKKK